LAELSPTEQTNEISPWQISCTASFSDNGRLATEREYCTPARKTAERGAMKNERGPTTYLTIEEVTEIAAEKYEQAAALAPSYQKDELLRSAEDFRSLAIVKGWLPSELRPPK
jgi:hypothetical protein